MCAALLLVTGCTHTVGGTATRSLRDRDAGLVAPVDVESVMLDRERMRAITGAGENLTVIPSMDGTAPVDIDNLADATPPQCQWIFAETQTFGGEIRQFHKTTFQNPNRGALISEGAAIYNDAPTAKSAFDGLVAHVQDCAASQAGEIFVGGWSSTADALRMHTGACSRDYRLKSAVLAEVISCAYSDDVPDRVLTNMLAKVPE
jgi:hypothetical protein